MRAGSIEASISNRCAKGRIGDRRDKNNNRVNRALPNARLLLYKLLSTRSTQRYSAVGAGDQTLFASYHFARLENSRGIESEAGHLVADRQRISVAKDERFLAPTIKRDASIAGVDQHRHIAPRRHILFAFRDRVRQTVRRRKQFEYGVGSDLLESPLLPFRRKCCDALVGDERRIRSLDRAVCQRKQSVAPSSVHRLRRNIRHTS